MTSSAEALDVLIVDDDPALLRTLSDVLRMRGFDPGVAQTGRDAMVLASKAPPAIAVIDLRLPDMDGLDLISRLHTDGALTQVVVLTGNASITSAVRALREEIVDYLLKPVVPDQLVATLERAGERWRRRVAEVALATTEQRFRSLIENAADPIAILGEDSTIQYASPAHQQALGKAPEALLGTPLYALVHPQDLPLMQEAMRAVLAKPSVASSFTLRFRGGDGTWRTLAGTAKNMLSNDAICGIVLNTRDISERVELEAQLRHAQKMDAMGQLAGGVAHDLNNILTAVTAFTQLAAGSLPPDHEVQEDLTQVQSAAKRAASLTRQLLAFSRRQVLQPRPLDLGEIVRGMRGMLRSLLGAEFQVVMEIAPAHGRVLADAGQIEQVLLNLVINARDAMPKGGTIVIEVQDETVTEEYTRRHPGAQPGAHVMLGVTDSGSGMDAETRTRMFEPFFTTKPMGKGTGLGLSTVYGIVQQSGGHIWVYSEMGHGTTLKVYLPRYRDEHEEEAQPATSVQAASTPATVLVVEDDPAVQRVTVRTLERAGYEVVTADNGREGLARIERLNGQLDLVIADVIMPDLGGAELAERIVAHWPDLPLLLMSGYTAQAIDRMVPLVGGAMFLEKPFTPDALVAKVESALRHRRQR
ncbi:MAG TPA: response regulator [Gemmatimonadaceae bacterium]|nr:response regulator [Gemmatimonadaceae bacterium]